jgi:hypothetical protein
MSSSDQFLFEASSFPDTASEPFVQKKTVFIQDEQNGVYSGQISFTLESIANSGLWADYSNAYILLPFTVVATCDRNVSNNPINPSLISIKNGFQQLVHSLQVSWNGQTLIQQSNFLNAFTTFKLMTEMSVNDVEKDGASWGFASDTASSFRYNEDGNVDGGADGAGFSNNRVLATPIDYTTRGSDGATANEGLAKRISWVYDNSDNGGTGRQNSLGGTLHRVVDQNALNQRGAYGVYNEAGVGAARKYYWTYNAKIKLAWLHDLFDKLPLTRNSFLKISIFYNSSVSTKVKYTHAGQSITLDGAPLLTGRTNPIMFCSAERPVVDLPRSAQPGFALFNTLELDAGGIDGNDIPALNADRTLTIQAGLGRINDVAHPLSSGRLYIPLYQMNEPYLQQYLNTNPSITVPYYDLFQYRINGVPAGGDTNQLITSGIVNPLQLVMIPLVTADPAAIIYDPLASPFTTEPGTTSPLAQLSNLQIYVSGQAVFSNGPLDYTWEQYLNEIKPLGLNGGNSMGLTSGLLDENKWDVGFHYVCVDLSRRVPIDDGIAKSISVQFRNNSNLAFDFLIFVKYGRTLTIETATGIATSS